MMNPSENTLSNRFKSFAEFYPFYLSEHRGRACKQLHFVGTALLIGIVLMMAVTGAWNLWWLVPLCGYGFAWVGHFVFEKNRPATFKYPFYSMLADFVMFWHLVSGRLSFETNSPLKAQRG